MRTLSLAFSLFVLGASAIAQSSAAALSAQTAVPILFTRSVSAAHAHSGDVVLAKTTQVVRLSDGTVLQAGSKVIGHVVEAHAFSFDRTPYAKQTPGRLTVRFDNVESGSMTLPLRVSVRALASPLAVNDAEVPPSTDLDSLGTLSQIGGDQLVPSQVEVRDRNGDVVAYHRRNGVFAHLIANGRCDGGNTETSVDVFSASACGLYGFGDVSAAVFGSGFAPSQLELVSTHGSPELWKSSEALLEVLPGDAR